MKDKYLRNVAMFVLTVCTSMVSFALAQETETRVKTKDLPKAVQQTVQAQSRGATLRGLSKEVENGATIYEAEFKVNGHNRDVSIDVNGNVVEIEEEVALSSLPPAVKATIEKNAGKGKITTVEAVTKNNSLVAYEAHVKAAGKRSEIKVDPDGKLITK